MPVVFDTNIYISAFAIPGGHGDEAYVEAIRGRFELFTSVAILTETAKVLQLKFTSSRTTPTIASWNVPTLLTQNGSSQAIAISWH